MISKWSTYILISSFILCTSCARVELEDDEKDPSQETTSKPSSDSDDDDDDEDNGYSSDDDIYDDDYDDDDYDDGGEETIKYISVSKAQELYEIEYEPFVKVEGYIVGAIEGTSISKYHFGSDVSVESNILIADDSTETDIDACIPVELKKNSDERIYYNLYSNPSMLHKRIVVAATLTKYFRVAGLKKVIIIKTI